MFLLLLLGLCRRMVLIDSGLLLVVPLPQRIEMPMLGSCKHFLVRFIRTSLWGPKRRRACKVGQSRNSTGAGQCRGLSIAVRCFHLWHHNINEVKNRYRVPVPWIISKGIRV
ncbi:hypothetical protein BDZ89DRAFT_1070522 [Hymenopellis radicata]|nr:hypothetical protein BDZ89DRAFT_1070522 [Hymenopellis radicata]